MRATVLILLLLLCHSYAHAYQFIFKNGKKISGTILYEDSSIYRMVDTSGVEMRIRKSELNLAATQSTNVVPEESLVQPPEQTVVAARAPAKRTVRVYSNRDVASSDLIHSTEPHPDSERGWITRIHHLEKELSRLEGACRGAGTGPNLSKILRTHTYDVQGKPVKVTAYWADPANIEDAKQICRRAIQTENALRDARKGFAEFQQKQQKPSRGR